MNIYLFTVLLTHLFTYLLTIFVNKYYNSLEIRRLVGEIAEENEGSHEGDGHIVHNGAGDVHQGKIHLAEGLVYEAGARHILLIDEGHTTLGGMQLRADGVAGATGQGGEGGGPAAADFFRQIRQVGIAVVTHQAGSRAGRNQEIVCLLLRIATAHRAVSGLVVTRQQHGIVNDGIAFLQLSGRGADVPLPAATVQAHAPFLQQTSLIYLAQLLHILVALHVGTGRNKQGYGSGYGLIQRLHAHSLPYARAFASLFPAR